MMATPSTIAVLGASGFVGSAVVERLQLAGHQIVPVRAPRLRAPLPFTGDVGVAARRDPALPELVVTFGSYRVDVVINVAGASDATGRNDIELLGANALLPRVVREAALEAGVERFVHVSSAGVQGRRSILDESAEMAPFSPYTRSKAWGERALIGCPETVIYRPTSVHGAGRRVTRSLISFARSSFASVAGDGTRVTPQVLVQNVASGIAFVAATSRPLPRIVLHPSEQLTTESLLWALGATRVRHVPDRLAGVVLGGLRTSARRSAGFAANTRRLEMLWYGQRQVAGWLEETGWRAPLGREGWTVLGGR